MNNLYYGNHDLIMAYNKDCAWKFINTFVALNTPEKLDPLDRSEFHQFDRSLRKWNGLKSLILGSGISLVFFRDMRLRAISLPLLSFGFLSYYNQRSDFKLMTSPLMDNFINKYDFSVFDFHDSKRSSIYKTIIQSIKSESTWFINNSLEYYLLF